MNKDKRKMLQNAIRLINNATLIIERVRDMEQDCINNMPENLEFTDKYAKMEDAVDFMDDALSGVSEVVEKIDLAAA